MSSPRRPAPKKKSPRPLATLSPFTVVGVDTGEWASIVLHVDAASATAAMDLANEWASTLEGYEWAATFAGHQRPLEFGGSGGGVHFVRLG